MKAFFAFFVKSHTTQGFVLLGGEEDAQGVDWTDEILRFVPGVEQWEMMAQVGRAFELPYFMHEDNLDKNLFQKLPQPIGLAKAVRADQVISDFC